jgi:hypothetical protein
VFPEIETPSIQPTPGAGKDDLIDAAVAAWTAPRITNGETGENSRTS